MAVSVGGLSRNVFFGGGGVSPGGPGAASAISVFNVRTYGVPFTGSDATPALLTLANITMGGKGTMYFPPGDFTPLTALDVPAGIDVWMAQGARLMGTGTVRVRGKLFFEGGQHFDPGLVLTLDNRETDLRYEYWGPHSVLNETIDDDAHAASNRLARLACHAVLNGHTVKRFGMYTVDRDITYPNTAFTIIGSSATTSGLKGATVGITSSVNAPVNYLNLDNLTGCSGPAKRFSNCQNTGPSPGVSRDIGYLCPSNGVVFDTCWARGCTYGWVRQGSYNSCINCTAEFCSIGVQFDTNPPIESMDAGWNFYRNVNVDVRVTQTAPVLPNGGAGAVTPGLDCKGAEIASLVSIGCGTGAGLGTVVEFDNVKRFKVGSVHVGTDATNPTKVVHWKNGASKCDVVSIKALGVAVTYGAYLEWAINCTVDLLDVDGAGTGLYLVNAATAGNHVRKFVARNCTVAGMNIDTPAGANLIENYDVQTCAIGLQLSTENVEFRNGNIAANTVNYSFPLALLTTVKSWNMTSDNFGLFVNASGKVGAIFFTDEKGRKTTYGAAAPIVGAWAVGDICYNTAPASAGFVGWVCTVAGTSGTWKTFGLIS